mgnify:CR=1 FL=1
MILAEKIFSYEPEKRDSVQKELNPLGWMIFMIEVSETPARTYVMSLLD